MANIATTASRRGRKEGQIERGLEAARDLYLSLETFPFRDKCLASNLLIRGALALLQGSKDIAYRRLLHARFALTELDISAEGEAVAEVSRLVKIIVPEAHAIVFSRDFGAFLKTYADGPFLAKMTSVVTHSWIDRRWAAHDVLVDLDLTA
jgi:hypothetical protein